MVEVGFRDVGMVGPAGHREEPSVAPPSRELAGPAIAQTPDVIVTPPPARHRPAVGGERTESGDALGLDPLLGRLAELVALGRTATPVTIGFCGGPGVGKSFALGRTLNAVRDLATAAGKANGSPFLSRIHLQPIDAAALDGDITSGMAACLHAGLRRSYPDLARDIAHTARDPSVVLREVSEKLDDARRRLDVERRALEDAGSRRARLTETVLFEGAGSQVDAFARANRTGIEGRLAAFGIGGDAVRSYKELVQFVAGSGGKVGLAIRSLWAFKGQTKLIVTAVILCLVGIGLGVVFDDQDSWLESLRGGPQIGVGVANWAAAHMGWLATARTAAFALAALAILANIWRAFAFLAPVFKGARLLGNDLETRRRDLDGLFAHQTKRVDTLDGDVDRLTREVAAAEKRLGGSDSFARHEPSPFASPPAVQAQEFFANLGTALADAKGRAAPQRIVLAIDHLDAVAPERARAILDALHRAAGNGFVGLVAVEATRLDPDGSRQGETARWIDVPVRLDAERGGNETLVAQALGRSVAGPASRQDATQSVLDEPLGDDEAHLLTAMAPMAGASPRAVKRFVSLYTLARLEPGLSRGALALMLALRQGGSVAEKAIVSGALGKADAGSAAGFGIPAQASGRLAAAFATAHEFDGTFSAADAVAAVRSAARYSHAD